MSATAGRRRALERIVVLGGYGAVGREAVTALGDWFTGEIVVAGRDLARASGVPGTTPLRVDLRNPADVERAVTGADTVLNCVEQNNARVAEVCLRAGIHYLDVTATPGILRELAALDPLARGSGATAVLSVGLAPGVTNLLASLCGATHAETRIGVLLGAGERHGPAAVEWTLDGLAELGPRWSMRFPAPYGVRVVRQFPFADQHTLPGTLGVDRVVTGLCLDSRPATALLGLAGLPGVRALIRKPPVRSASIAALTRMHLGGDGFAVVATNGVLTASFTGRRQSRATGLVAASLIRHLEEFEPGTRHIETLVDPSEFLTGLTQQGFDLRLGQYAST